MSFFDDYMDTVGPGAIAHLFNGGSDPSKQADKYYDRIPDTLKQYLNPYVTAGQGAMGDLTKQYSDLMSDPGSILARIGKGYSASPGFEFAKNNGLNSINNAAAAGGMMGSASHQQDAGELSTNLANQDYGNYMKQAMGLWGKGLEGKEHINDMGFDASKSLAENLAQAMMSQGNLAYAGQASRNKARGDMFSDLSGMGMAALMM